MAVRSSSVEARRLASPTIRTLMHQRSAELLGLALGLLGLALLVALACYDPRDPSLNTATTRHASNLAGPVGAMVADLLLQGFGVAGALPGLAMLSWAWRIASRRGLGSMAARLAAMLAAMPVLAGVLASVPTPPGFAWPTVAGLGGAIGDLLGTAGLAAGSGLLGPVGALMVWTIGLALAVTLTLLTLGLSSGEWRAAGRFVGRTARFSVSGSRDAADALRRFSPRPRFRFPRLPRLFRRRDPEITSLVRREPVSATHMVPALDEPAPPPPPISMARTTRQAVPFRKPRQESLPLDEAGW